MKKQLYLYLFFFLFTTTVSAQNNVDSLIKTLPSLPEDTSKIKVYNEIAFALRKNEPARALGYAEKGVELAEKIKSLKWTATLSSTLAILYRNTDQFDKAIKTAAKAMEIGEKTKDYRVICIVSNTLASLYNITGDLEKAQKYYFVFLRSAETLNDEAYVAKALGNIANLFISQKKYKEALAYNLKAIAVKERIGSKEDRAGTYNNIGLCYSFLHDYENSYKNHSKALNIWEELGDKSGMANSYNHIGFYFQHHKNYKKCIEYNNKALALQEAIGDSLGMIYSYKNIAETYLEAKNIPLSISYYKTAEKIAISIGVIAEQAEVFGTLSDVYEKAGDYKQALHYQRQYFKATDSLLNEKSNKNMIEMQTKYQTEKKEQELALQKTQIEKKDVEVKQHKTQRNAFIIGFCFLLVLAFVIFRSLQQNKKAKQIIELQKQKVDEAYEELNQQNEEISAQRDEIERQKELVEEHQKETLDSIHYAKRIQRALLTSHHYIQKHLNVFILYKPKDIVSGDFYWALKKNEEVFVAVADCTGHGVPGAFMSMIGINLLNEIVLERNVTNPALVLDIMREEIIRSLNPEGADEESKDGMDMILAKFNMKELTLDYAAANNAFYIIRDNELLIQKADKMPVGKYHDKVESFTKRSVQLQKNDLVYLITDGYADQFGGPKGKKFKYKQMEDVLLANVMQPMEKQQQRLEKHFEEWKGSLEQVDDVTIVGIKI